MKLVEHFNTFLADVVNLNQTRLDLLDASADTLVEVIRKSDWEPRIRSFVRQGSWAHKTIIRPVDGKAFDADLLVLVDPVEDWSAKEYISTLRAVFSASKTYEDKVRRFSHCITLEYVGERKIDIAPCIVRGANAFDVCNFNADQFEQSAPERYTDWLIERNSWTGGDGLRKVTRLLKYLRDVKTTFTCPSVLLTTLLGGRISQTDSFSASGFEDVPTALRTIVSRLDDWLQLRSSRPVVSNPALPSEDLGALWDDVQYSNFRDKINLYRGWIDDAYSEEDRNESISKWRRVFEEGFARGIVESVGADVSVAALDESTAPARPNYFEDLVARFNRLGSLVLPAHFDRLPYKMQPRWRRAPGSAPFGVDVRAARFTKRHGTFLSYETSGNRILPKGQSLRFDALTHVGSAIGGGYDVRWRITNTDREAAQARALRGKFEEPNDGQSRWEDLEYRGVHTAEAFVIRKRDNVLVTQSKPFYVVIE